jgi:hypothetical protein
VQRAAGDANLSRVPSKPSARNCAQAAEREYDPEPMMLRCPFAVLGLDSDQMAACPGYDGEVVTFGMTAAGVGNRGRTCLHMGAEQGPRGYVGGCHHPEADVVLPRAAELCRAEINLNRPRVVIDPLAEVPKPPATGSPAAWGRGA